MFAMAGDEPGKASAMLHSEQDEVGKPEVEPPVKPSPSAFEALDRLIEGRQNSIGMPLASSTDSGDNAMTAATLGKLNDQTTPLPQGPAMVDVETDTESPQNFQGFDQPTSTAGKGTEPHYVPSTAQKRIPTVFKAHQPLPVLSLSPAKKLVNCQDCVPTCYTCTSKPVPKLQPMRGPSECANCCNPISTPLCGILSGSAKPSQKTPGSPLVKRPMKLYRAHHVDPTERPMVKRKVHRSKTRQTYRVMQPQPHPYHPHDQRRIPQVYYSHKGYRAPETNCNVCNLLPCGCGPQPGVF